MKQHVPFWSFLLVSLALVVVCSSQEQPEPPSQTQTQTSGADRIDPIAAADSEMGDRLQNTNPAPAVVTLTPRMKKRKRKGKGGSRRRKLSTNTRNNERTLRRLYSQNAADRACLKWSPDLKVKVVAMSRAVQVDYCTNSASPRTRTCIFSSPSSGQCHVLEQGNCTTTFDGLEPGTSYKLMIKPYCRCQDRSDGPCAVTTTYGGPYQLPATEALVKPRHDSISQSTVIIVASVSVLAVFMAFVIPLLCWLLCKRKSSNGDDLGAPRFDTEHTQTESSHRSTSGPPIYARQMSQADVDSLACAPLTGSETVLKEPCTDLDSRVFSYGLLRNNDFNSCVTLDACKIPLVNGATQSTELSEVSEVSRLLEAPWATKPTGASGAGQATGFPCKSCHTGVLNKRVRTAGETGEIFANDSSPSTMQMRVIPGLGGANRNTGEDLQHRDILDGRPCELHHAQAWEIAHDRTSRTLIPNRVVDAHQNTPLRRFDKFNYGRVSPNQDNMIEIPMDLLYAKT